MALRIGFLASYNGSSMQMILLAAQRGELGATGAVVISNQPSARALDVAVAWGIPNYCLNVSRCGGEAETDRQIAETLLAHDVDVVVLSGYLKRIGPETLNAFSRRILNIHPSLLPAFGGEGMYGRRVHEAVLAAGVHETGVTVHLVDEVYDHGEILAQVRVPVEPMDTPDTLSTRVAACEGDLFVRVLSDWRLPMK